jgi:hypothetical protein
MDYWEIALYGTDTYYNPDSDSLVDLSTLGTTNPMTDTNWLKVKIAGASPKKEAFNSPGKHIGGISTHAPAQKQIYQLKLEDYTFPDDMAELEKLYTLFRKRYIYFFKGTYDFTSAYSWAIHPDGKAIMVSAVGKTEDDYDHGIKSVTIDLQKVNPVV